MISPPRGFMGACPHIIILSYIMSLNIFNITTKNINEIPSSIAESDIFQVDNALQEPIITRPCKSIACAGVFEQNRVTWNIDGSINKDIKDYLIEAKIPTQKRIQNTVRVPSSLYTQNLGALSSFQFPYPQYRVNWQQSSDRRERHIQLVTVPTRGSSLRSSITRFDRPGCASPGGAGVDMKHGSYQRYLNRIMAKGPLRSEIGPDRLGIPFNPAFPIYGGKTYKTTIINRCPCLPLSA
jgi:hypothetical protein